jgi:hypothetical protein
MTKNISAIITEIAKKEGIDYQSINPVFIEFYNDAKRIGEIIREFESLIDELDCILARHKIGNGIKKQMEIDIREFWKIHHDLKDLAIKIQKENK